MSWWKTPWPDISNEFAYAALAIEVTEINGEPHANGVNAFAGENPESFTGLQAFPPQQALSAAFAGKGRAYATGDQRPARLVENREPGSRGARRGRPRLNSTASEHDLAPVIRRACADERQ